MECNGIARQATVGAPEATARISVLLALPDSPQRGALTELLEAFGDAVRKHHSAACSTFRACGTS